MNLRLAAWIVIVIAATIGETFRLDWLVAIALPLGFVLLGIGAPAALRWAMCTVALVLAVAFGLGGLDQLIEIVPVLVPGFAGWLFARSLAPGRRPLIARIIATIDGPEFLRDAVVVGYATRLTRLWAALLFALALGAIASIARAHDVLPTWPFMPHLFGTAVLPFVVVAAFLGEYSLRPRWVPQVPRQPLGVFVRDLAQAWPCLIEE